MFFQKMNAILIQAQMFQLLTFHFAGQASSNWQLQEVGFFSTRPQVWKHSSGYCLSLRRRGVGVEKHSKKHIGREHGWHSSHSSYCFYYINTRLMFIPSLTVDLWYRNQWAEVERKANKGNCFKRITFGRTKPSRYANPVHLLYPSLKIGVSLMGNSEF